MRDPTSLQSRRRTGLRYTILLFIVFALVAGWTGFWKFAASKAQETIEGWRAREAKAGRLYNCGSQTIGGFPFRIEVNCDDASAQFRSNQPPLELKTSALVVMAQVYQPGLLISESHGPLTIGESETAGPHRRLEVGPIERARHARGAQSRVVCARPAGNRPHEGGQQAKPFARETY
jgi:hypothetical protein